MTRSVWSEVPRATAKKARLYLRNRSLLSRIDGRIIEMLVPDSLSDQQAKDRLRDAIEDKGEVKLSVWMDSAP